jgi:hypothetical protein
MWLECRCQRGKQPRRTLLAEYTARACGPSSEREDGICPRRRVRRLSATIDSERRAD